MPEEKVYMKGYKGFEPGLICRGKQYAENTVFEEERAEICESGMHFCENPFEVLNHYPIVDENGNFSDFAEVEVLDKPITNNEKKYCTKKLKIGAKLKFSEFIKACVDFVVESCKIENANGSGSGDSAQIGSSGDCAQIGSSGDGTHINSEGESSVICCAGHNCMVKAKAGSWITLAEWECDAGKSRYIPKCVKTEFVDGERIKADTWYKLVDGQFKEAE